MCYPEILLDSPVVYLINYHYFLTFSPGSMFITTITSVHGNLRKLVENKSSIYALAVIFARSLIAVKLRNISW